MFKTTVQRVLANGGGGEGTDTGSVPSDYDLIARLEAMVASQRRHRETAKCLEASLKQLERGFKTGYSDALTLLNSDL